MSKQKDSKNTETSNEFYTLLYTGGLGRYLIMVGIRSLEYTYTDEQIFANVEYFDKCRKRGLSAYKALLFFHDYLNGEYDI
tara:strand:- start:351 stop:593 length:243 start_codon:yes stop_codon:yes gene_type:complete